MKSYIRKMLLKIIKYINFINGITTIDVAQRKLAFDDSQKFIYDKSSLNTLSFSGPNAVTNLHRKCIDDAPKDGLLFEFGVFKGKSITRFADWLRDAGDERKIYGFDSFQGFSEEWSGVNESYKIDTFDLHGKFPKVPKNVILVDGFIEKTLPNFIGDNQIEKVSFIHIDTDTYTPAKVALQTLKPFIKKGTIILFDELCGYPNWRNHEYKALSEVFEEDEYEFLGFAHNTDHAFLIKAAIRIL